MTDMNELKRIVQTRIELEAERAELFEQIPSVEKKIKKLTYLVEEAQSNYGDLENSKLRLFFLGVTGKKEERLQEAQNEVRRTRSELTAAEFELHSMNDRIEAIALELNVTESVFDEYLNRLEGAESEEMKERMIALKELPNLRHLISEKMIELKKLFLKAEEIWQYGDIQTDLSGRRYNKKDSTLRNHSKLIQRVVAELIELLEKYNTFAPEETKIIFHEDWMDNKDYWANQQIVDDSHARIKKVDDWFYRLENGWNKMKKQQNEAEEILRDEITEFLRY